MMTIAMIDCKFESAHHNEMPFPFMGLTDPKSMGPTECDDRFQSEIEIFRIIAIALTFTYIKKFNYATNYKSIFHLVIGIVSLRIRIIVSSSSARFSLHFFIIGAEVWVVRRRWRVTMFSLARLSIPIWTVWLNEWYIFHVISPRRRRRHRLLLFFWWIWFIGK